jgi:CBS domain containing-hemolysin-like protein
VTLEDVLEALLQEQIYDEMDAAGRVTESQSEDDNDADGGNVYHLV